MINDTSKIQRIKFFTKWIQTFPKQHPPKTTTKEFSGQDNKIDRLERI